ncbi:hypothetical protein KAJ83_09750 [Marivibrio halodurans]|uniref:Uncharacterized protein n=1 Tax=Marivibrio halodurans TaxID=2039722 RepID=A0A8J7V2V2_9PROT|nr:hypothetical protein [Marivibrio halodurans]MBP5857292.1 hypothetical protein [Marivibrio halodurans]
MLADAEAHLESGLGPSGNGALKSVDGAVSFQALAAKPPQGHQLPAAFVIPVSERGQEMRAIGAVRQRVATRFGVVLALGGRNNPRGDGLSAELDDLTAAIKDRFRGWQATAHHEETEFRQGRATAFQRGVVYYLLEFETAVQEGE